MIVILQKRFDAVGALDELEDFKESLEAFIEEKNSGYVYSEFMLKGSNRK